MFFSQQLGKKKKLSTSIASKPSDKRKKVIAEKRLRIKYYTSPFIEKS